MTLLLILIPTTLSIYLFAQVRSLNRQLDAAGSQLAAMQEQLPSTAPEGGESTPAEPEPPAAEVPAYTPSCTPTIRCAAPWTWTTPST